MTVILCSTEKLWELNLSFIQNMCPFILSILFVILYELPETGYISAQICLGEHSLKQRGIVMQSVYFIVYIIIFSTVGHWTLS